NVASKINPEFARKQAYLENADTFLNGCNNGARLGGRVIPVLCPWCGDGNRPRTRLIARSDDNGCVLSHGKRRLRLRNDVISVDPKQPVSGFDPGTIRRTARSHVLENPAVTVRWRVNGPETCRDGVPRADLAGFAQQTQCTGTKFL